MMALFGASGYVGAALCLAVVVYLFIYLI